MKYILILLLTISTSWAIDLKPIFKQVSQEYSVSYELLSKMAWIESNHRIGVKAGTSSARGLFQIIRSTERWLREICDIEGDIYDPLTNTMLGACYIQFNTKYLQRKLKRIPTDLECYLAHLLGARKALKMIRRGNNELARKGFKRESRANRNLFYKRGKSLTVKQFKQKVQDKLDNARVL